MPSPGTLHSKIQPYNLVTVKTFKTFRRQIDKDADKDLFMEIANTASEVMHDIILNDKEGLKLPYVGLVIAYNTKPTQDAIDRYFSTRPHKVGKIKFGDFMGKIAWIRYKVSRFKLVRCYSFEPDRFLMRAVKARVATANYKFVTSRSEIHTYGRMLLQLDDTITRKLKRLEK